MAYSLSPLLKPRFFVNATNKPLVGGKLYTYLAETTTPATTYSNDTGTPNTNPIILDANGECNLYLDDSVSYRLILKDANDVPYFDKDRIASIGSTQVQSFNNIAALRLRSGTTAANAAKTLGYYSAGDGGGNSFYWDSTSTADHNGGTVVQPTSVSGAGRWLAVDTSHITPEIFGAKGDGSEVSSRMQAAANYCASNSCKLFLNRESSYYIATPLTANCDIDGNFSTIQGRVITSASDVILRDFKILSPMPNFALSISGQLNSRLANVQLINIEINFSGAADATRLGVVASYIDNLVIDNCRIDYAVSIVRCYNYRFTNNTVNGYNANENELLHATVRSYGIISSNTFLNSLDNWIDLYSSGETTLVVGNRFDGCLARLGTGIEIKVSLSDDQTNTSGGVNDYGFTRHIVIADNYFSNFNTSTAIPSTMINIYYIDNRAVPSFLWSQVPKSIIIDSNVFNGLSAAAMGGQMIQAIGLSLCEGVVVSNNIFRNVGTGNTNAASACIGIHDCKNVIVSSNHITSIGGCGISINGTVDTININNNQIVQDVGAGTIPDFGIHFQKIGARPSVVATNVMVSNNIIQAALASIRCINTSGTVTNCNFNGNICDNELVLENANKCTIINNTLSVKSARFKALGVGYTGGVVAYNTISNNTINSLTTKSGMEIIRCRTSVISQNIIHTPNHAIFVSGTNAAGELDFLTIKDNYSVNQASGLAFPFYSAMSAGDTLTLVVVNNQKVT
jgi:hypothetical protein